VTQSAIAADTGGIPYGASCVTGAGDELRMPLAVELEMCRFQGEHVSRIASRFGPANAT
jgi:hypothetical protein